MGGVISCVISNCPVGLGEPLFDKLNAKLAHAIMCINAVKGIQFGDGFDSANYKGSQLNDEFVNTNGQISLKSNHSGGIQGGISNGEDIYFETVFKPTATINKQQQTVDTSGNEVSLNASGRHDPCVLPRAVAIVEAMAALVIADSILPSKGIHIVDNSICVFHNFRFGLNNMFESKTVIEFKNAFIFQGQNLVLQNVDLHIICR